jgi:hypothetical protein
MRFLQPEILWYPVAFLCIPTDDRKKSYPCCCVAVGQFKSWHGGMEDMVTFVLLLKKSSK